MSAIPVHSPLRGGLGDKQHLAHAENMNIKIFLYNFKIFFSVLGNI